MDNGTEQQSIGKNSLIGKDILRFFRFSLSVTLIMIAAKCGGNSSGRLTNAPDPIEPPTPIAAPSPEMSKTIANISPELDEAIGSDGVEALLTTFNQYTATYGCPYPSVSFRTGDFSIETTTFTDGSREIVLETADSGYVEFDPSTLDSNNVIKLSQIRDTTRHALTHACSPAESTLALPLIAVDGSGTIIGTKGTTILYRLKGVDRVVYFKTITEGIAEALAYKLDNSHAVSHKGYYRIGSLTLAILGSTQDLSRMSQSENGGLEFVARTLGKPVEMVTYEDVEKFKDWYSRAFDTDEDLSHIVDEIIASYIIK